MKKRAFQFSYKISIVGVLLITIFCRLSYWQWTRHESKMKYISTMQERLEKPVSAFTEVLKDQNTNWSDFTYRRLRISGEYDFSKEMILRNRRYEGVPGVHVITPLKISGTEAYVLVNRGFITLDKSKKALREVFHKTLPADFVGLVKMSARRKMFAPKDPETSLNGDWQDAWLRINISAMQKQIPYEVLPISLEIISKENDVVTPENIVQSKSGKAELLSLPLKGIPSANVNKLPKEISAYPIPVFNTVIPPGRHFGYIFEWLFIALLTFCICFLLQLRRPKVA